MPGGLVERRGRRGDTRYTLSAEGIRYVTHRDRAQLPTTQGIWSTALTTGRQGRRRHEGHRIETWARQTKHADGITWFLSKLEAEARADPDSDLVWSVPTARRAICPLHVGSIAHTTLRRCSMRLGCLSLTSRLERSLQWARMQRQAMGEPPVATALTITNRSITIE